MDQYEKLIFLQGLNEDLNKQDNPEAFKEISDANKQALQVLLSQEKTIEKRSTAFNRHMMREFICEDYATADKARLVDKEYISGGQLQLTFMKDGETFTKLYEEGSYEYNKNKKREDKIEAEHNQHVQLEEATANFFNS